MRNSRLFSYLALAVIVLGSLAGVAAGPAPETAPSYDITTLAGKVASLNSTQGLQIRFSALIEHEAEIEAGNPDPNTPVITPTHVLSSSLDGDSILSPAVTVNQDRAAAPQNEPAIAVDPNNPARVVVGANDYGARTWDCQINDTPCSALGDGYPGTYYANDGGQMWAGVSTRPGELGTLIPGVTRLAGGVYEAGGSPSLAFDSQGNVFYAGLGFNHTTPPNTVAVNRGTFDEAGNLTWSLPTFINPTTAPSTFNDKAWIAADWHTNSPFRDRIYVSWTRFIFNPDNGQYVRSPIFLAYSGDGGQTFDDPKLVSSPVLYSQGSRPVVGYDGTVYVFWEGATGLATPNSIYVARSSDGGVTWSKPVAVAALQDILPIANTNFQVNSFPAAAAAPNGDLYVAWSTLMSDDGGLCATRSNEGCHAVAVYSQSGDGGTTWSDPAPIFPALDEANRTAEGYPVAQPDGSGDLNAPAERRADTFWPAVAVSPDGAVYMSAYAADVVSPWQTCAEPAEPAAVGRIDCRKLGNFVDNARLNYYVADMSNGTSDKVSPHAINTRHDFGGGFFGGYTGLAVDSDGHYHAVWTDTNNRQEAVWWYGYQFVPTAINQQDIATVSGPLQ